MVFLRFTSGTVDLPLHVHEFSDRFIVIDTGVGLFHYAPSADQPDELRSLFVQAGDVVMLTGRLLHTFTAPLEDLVLLSYHAPFYAFDDPRQFPIPRQTRESRLVWTPGRLLSIKEDSVSGLARAYAEASIATEEVPFRHRSERRVIAYEAMAIEG